MGIVIGTAGHIDHGKTTLIKALTGIDTDRLPDEKRRGITIDIGFAEMRAGDKSVSFVDVPGHEKFVKNMLAGATGIDAVMLAVSADDGVMPQTREHFEICRLLGVKEGVVVITKSSLAEPEMIDLVREDIQKLVKNSFLEARNIFVTDAKSGLGLEPLREHLLGFSAEKEAKLHKAFRLPIDRAFSRKGFGTVITGTVSAGAISEGDEIELYPTGAKARIRGLQNHDRPVKQGVAGMRLAMNVAGTEREHLARGIQAGKVSAFRAVSVFDAAIEVCRDVKPLADRQQIRVHIGTQEIIGRVSIFGAEKNIASENEGFVRLRLNEKTIAAAGDRFVIRSISPVETIAGGVVLDPQTEKHRGVETVRFLREVRESLDDPERIFPILLAAAGEKGSTAAELAAFAGDDEAFAASKLDSLAGTGKIVKCGSLFAGSEHIAGLERKITKELASLHKSDQLARGFRPDDIKKAVARRAAAEVFREALARLERSGKIAIDSELVRLAEGKVSLTDAETRFSKELGTRLEAAGLEVPKFSELVAEIAAREKIAGQNAEKLVWLLVSQGELVKVSDDLYFTRRTIEQLTAKVRAISSGEIDVPAFKAIAGVSRKYAIPLLEYFDREKVTTRRPDGSRVILKEVLAAK